MVVKFLMNFVRLMDKFNALLIIDLEPNVSLILIVMNASLKLFNRKIIARTDWLLFRTTTKRVMGHSLDALRWKTLKVNLLFVWNLFVKPTELFLKLIISNTIVTVLIRNIQLMICLFTALTQLTSATRWMILVMKIVMEMALA